jgi:protein-disulfide isomerase
MKPLAVRLRAIVITTLSALAWLAFASAPGAAQTTREATEAIIKDYLASHPDEVGEIAKTYLLKHPEILRDMFAELLKRRAATRAGGAKMPDAIDKSAVISSNATALFESPHQVTLGNPAGDVTLVEFFDYSCGFCKRALADLTTLIHDDPKLKVVLKEFPVLGPGSVDAAHVAIAVRMQDPHGAKYFAFHQQLLSQAGPADKTKALAAAKDQNLDMTLLQTDMAGTEAEATIAETFKLTAALGINGTPTYVIGDHILVGAVGLPKLRSEVALARSKTVR